MCYACHIIIKLISISVIRYVFFFLMIRRPPRSTQSRSSAASDVYKRQVQGNVEAGASRLHDVSDEAVQGGSFFFRRLEDEPVSYTHLRAHETVLDLVCRLLLEKKKTVNKYDIDHQLQFIKISMNLKARIPGSAIETVGLTNPHEQ